MMLTSSTANGKPPTEIKGKLTKWCVVCNKHKRREIVNYFLDCDVSRRVFRGLLYKKNKHGIINCVYFMYST
jgi:hypothetical protein